MTWKIKHKRLQTVISVTRNQEAKAESSPAGRGGRCLRKLSRKGEEGPKAAKSHRKRILSRRNSRCKGPEAGKNLLHREKTPTAELMTSGELHG